MIAILWFLETCHAKVLQFVLKDASLKLCCEISQHIVFGTNLIIIACPALKEIKGWILLLKKEKEIKRYYEWELAEEFEESVYIMKELCV